MLSAFTLATFYTYIMHTVYKHLTSVQQNVCHVCVQYILETQREGGIPETHPSWVGEYRKVGTSTGLELIEILHEFSCLNGSLTTVVGTLQLVSKMDHLSGNVSDAVF